MIFEVSLRHIEKYHHYLFNRNRLIEAVENNEDEWVTCFHNENPALIVPDSDNNVLAIALGNVP